MSLPGDAHIGRVSLTISDLDRSVAFYRDVLGFTILGPGNPEEGVASTTLGPPGGGRTLIELCERRDAVPKPRRCAGLYHFAILVPSRAALGRSLGRLVEKGWPLTGASDHLVSEALYLNDPDGLGIEIYRDRPRESWSTAGGQVQMATEPLDLQALIDVAGGGAPWRGLEAGTVMGHVHLHVPHLDAAEAFYCGLVGFDATQRSYPGALFVAAGGYHHHLGLNTWMGIGAPPPPDTAVGLRSFTVESPALEPRELTDETTRVRVIFRKM